MWVPPILGLLFAATVCSKATAQAPTVTVDNGVFVGVATSIPGGKQSINRYLGIPYAVTPPKRFAPPEKAPASNQVRTAYSWAPACLQQGTSLDLPGVTPLNPPPPEDEEDCMYINVWTPSSAAPKGGRAVMFWIYGGAFVTGRSSQGMYDGAHFAANEDVVLVTFNYRLNAFGFPGPIPGIPTAEMNVGMLDMRMAIDWTKRNIASFGGDPSKITVFGESAGAIAADLLSLTTPNPQYRGVIFESGIYYLAGYGGGLLVGQTNSSSTSSQALSEDLSCGWDTNTLSCLRALPASNITSALAKTPRLWGPIPDGGANVPADYAGQHIRQTGGGARVPMLTGTNAHEAVLFLLDGNPATFAFMFSVRFPELQPYEAEIRAAYPFGSAPDAWPNEFMAVAMVLTDYMFTCLCARQARTNELSGVRTWRYHYSLPIGQAVPALALTVPHAFELPQVFGTYYPPNATVEQERVSAFMMGAWSAFAKDTAKGPGWAQYAGRESGNTVGEIGGSGNLAGLSSVSSDTIDANCKIFEPLYQVHDPDAMYMGRKKHGKGWRA